MLAIAWVVGMSVVVRPHLAQVLTLRKTLEISTHQTIEQAAEH